MGRINKDDLQTMLLNGRSQAECARHFQVSQAAICKAVKRLRMGSMPASLAALTDKQRAFVLNLAEGKTATESALQAYDCSSRDVAKTMGCRMAKEPDITAALADIMSQEGIPRRRRVQRLRDLIESKDLAAVSRGLDMSWKLDGSYAPEKVDVTGQLAAVHALIAEVRQHRKDEAEQVLLTAPEEPDIQSGM